MAGTNDSKSNLTTNLVNETDEEIQFFLRSGGNNSRHLVTLSPKQNQNIAQQQPTPKSARETAFSFVRKFYPDDTYTALEVYDSRKEFTNILIDSDTMAECSDIAVRAETVQVTKDKVGIVEVKKFSVHTTPRSGKIASASLNLQSNTPGGSKRKSWQFWSRSSRSST